MKQDWFDKKLTDSLQGFDSNMDFESAWGQIEAKRNKRKKRGLFIWGSSVGVAAVLVGVVFMFFVKNETAVVAVKTIGPDNPQSEIKENNKEIFYENKTGEPVGQINTLYSELASSVTDGQKPLGGNNQPNKKTDADLDEEKTVSGNQAALQTVNNNQVLNTYKSNSEKPKIETPSLIIPSVKRLEAPEELSVLPLAGMDHEQNQLPGLSLSVDLKTGRPSIYVGASMFYGKLFASKTSTLPENDEWVNVRKNTETPMDAVLSEVFVKKYFSKKIYAQTGIGFLQQTTRMELEVTNVRSENMGNQLLEIIRFADGTREEIYGEGTVEITDYKKATIYNRRRSVLLPLLLGMDFSVNKKMGINIGIGASVVLNNKIDGKIVSNENNLFEFVDLDNLGYKKRGSIYGNGTAGFYFNINKEWQVASGIGIMTTFEKLNGLEERTSVFGGSLSLIKGFY